MLHFGRNDVVAITIYLCTFTTDYDNMIVYTEIDPDSKWDALLEDDDDEANGHLTGGQAGYTSLMIRTDRSNDSGYTKLDIRPDRKKGVFSSACTLIIAIYLMHLAIG